MASTSVPRWSTRSLAEVEFDARAARHLIFTLDADALCHLDAHEHLVPTGAAVVDVSAGADPQRVVDEALVDARVGWRFVIVGAGAPVMRARARIMSAGAVESEIEMVSLDGPDGFAVDGRDVFCAHCHTVSATTARIDETVSCVGCGVELVVYHHFSRRHAAYLGYRPDSEELPASEVAR